MLCFGFFVWLSPPSCVCTVWCGMQSTEVIEERPTPSVKMAPTAQIFPSLMGKGHKVLKTGIQATMKAILPEEEIIPSQKPPMELKRNERPG